MNDYDAALFHIGDEDAPTEKAPVEPPIVPEQVSEIREAFDQAGIMEQDKRKALIESVVFRDVASLRELRAVESRRIIVRIRQRASAGPKPIGSAWETREEDTWIDKL